MRIVIAGSDSGLEGVLRRAKDEAARTAKRPQASVPSHCVLLKSVADELSRQIARIGILLCRHSRRELREEKQIDTSLGLDELYVCSML
jgi:malonyl CoA-acyl carrier protein transacylase